jgi:toxin ParE1/3/4
VPNSIVRLRSLAEADIDRVVRHYHQHSGPEVAVRFIDAIENTFGQISRWPGSGHLRFSYELDIPDLRVRSVQRFPYLVFYVVGEEVVDVWRVLHGRRDIPNSLTGDVRG